jgi:hypothetical protein
MKRGRRILDLFAMASLSFAGLSSHVCAQVPAREAPPESLHDAKVTEITEALRIDLTAYKDALRKSGKPPVDYLVGKFERRDLVLLGEAHGVRENCEFVASVLEPLYHRAGVRRFATEFVRSSNSTRVNRLVTGPAYDRTLAIEIMRDNAWPTWGYQEYMEILEAAWRLNASLPDGADPLVIVPLDSDWSQHDLFFKNNSPRDRFEAMRGRERHMAATLTDQILKPGHKALVHLGYTHSVTTHGELVGTVLRQAYGDRIFQVSLHHAFSDPRGQSSVCRLIERVVRELGGERIGFDVVGTPFAMLHDPGNVAFTFGGKRTFGELAQGYILLKPLDQLQPVHWIEGFIVDSNFKEALDVATRMGQADPRQHDSPAKLNARLKEVIESR